MLKKFVSIVLSASLILSMATISFGASNSEINVKLNGEETILKDEVYLNEKGQIMCPIREFAERLNYLITWNDEDNSITLSKGSEVIKLKIGEKSVVANGKDMNMSSNVVIKNEKAFVPLELFSNVLNLIVGWNNKAQNLKINQPKQNTEDYFKLSEDKAIQDKLDKYMQALEKNQNFHGNILVAKEDEVLLNKGYGFSDFQQNVRSKSQTKFAIGSITKQFTAMAIMQLEEKGMLDVEDKVSKYFSDFPNGDLITIHNLLTHTSGLANFTDLNEFYTIDLNNKNPENVLNLIKDKPLEFKPGEKCKYSNTGYLLLGQILEKVSGISNEEYLQKNIFDPLKMNDTGICYGKNNMIPDATAYTGFLEVIPVDDEIVLSQTYGAGSMYSTVEDLYRWDRALKAGKLVKKETLNKIFTKHAVLSGVDNYGYGWIINDTDIGKEIWHNGLTLGFTANIARYIDKDITVIILTNNRLYDTTSLTNTITSIIFNKDYKMPKALKEIKIDNPKIYDKYVGEYELFPNVIISITKENNNLYAQITGQDKCEIFPMSEKEYFYKIVDAQITFEKDENGQVTNLVLHQNSQDMSAHKIK